MADADAFAEALERAADRLRSLGESRLDRTGSDGVPSPADQARRLAVVWARVLEGPEVVVVPVTAFGAGDQLVVIGRELAARWRAGEVSPEDQQAAVDGLAQLRGVL